ncbi:MAG: hypothetical protein NT009_16365 [Proteobacteria bacterium]|nr:hypothetical protein [Pseudomonadota bacterium]
MKKFFIFLIASLLVVSLVSASWFSDIFGGGTVTGNVVDNTIYPNTGICVDSDNGINASEAGIVSILGHSGKSVWTTPYGDSCSGKVVSFMIDGKAVSGQEKLNELYCDNGKKTQPMTAADLGQGYCKVETLVDGGKAINSAKWVKVSPSCTYILGAGVPVGAYDEKGKKSYNGCTGTKFTMWSCNAGSDVAPKAEEIDCATADGKGRCTTAGCAGNCVERTDSENNKDVAGLVIRDGKAYPDACHPTNKRAIIQYRCSNGVAVASTSTWQDCGANRECVEDKVNGAYCKDIYASSVGALTRADVLKMLNGCHIDSLLTSKTISPSLNGNEHCAEGYVCVGNYFSEVSNPQAANYALTNAIRTNCQDVYNGHTSDYYIQTICC